MPTPMPGDPAPLFQLADAEGSRFELAAVAGRPVLLVVNGPAALPDAARGPLASAQASGLFDGVRALCVVCGAAPPGGPSHPGMRAVPDPDGVVARLYGAPAAFLLDPMLRVVVTAPLDALAAILAQLEEASRAPPPDLPAPVLLLPRVLEPELCQRLVAAFEAGHAQESGFMADRDGKLVWIYDRDAKRRRDAEIPDEALRAALRARIARRVAPEIRKAFQFDPTRIERYIVACYDAGEAGHFRAHRDNDTPGTAHRRFAVSINLNDGFEGGDIWFPEFGPRRWRAPAGGAIVFSCSILHEVTPVTRGRRYATLPFVFDEAAKAALDEAVRQRERRLAQRGG
ncbi:MAG TPA: 2OG-Fe(II) oxygenase [Acetobacteraceae bacterium]|nr:2OG-Fe(II) oxygenase [Acetobacteraceae bacterium]